MIRIGGIVSILPGPNGWVANTKYSMGNSFSDRCSALEWVLDCLFEKSGKFKVGYDIWPDRNSWQVRVERGAVKSFTTREGALEFSIRTVVKEILKHEKKTRK